jgi:hypothetical protein
MIFRAIFHHGRVGDRILRLLHRPVENARRARADALMSQFAAGGSAPCVESVVYDGTYDNANYWFRCSIVRRALGLASTRQTAFTGQYSAEAVRRTFERWGITDVRKLGQFGGPRKQANITEAQELFVSARAPEDILSWRFSCGLPASDVYDALLKRQRRGTLDLKDPRLPQTVADILDTFDAAANLFDDINPKLYLASHTASGHTAYGAILWAALTRGIEAIIPWGAYDTLRFYRIHRWSDVYTWANVPKRSDIAALSPPRAEQLARRGRDYIKARITGQTDDAAAVYAYRVRAMDVDRISVARRFGWSPDAPIVAIYASVWFDNPHVFGMSAFTDFDDWLSLTARVAAATPQINYLFKAHPSEEFYGGPTLADMLSRLPHAPNVALCPNDWNGRFVMEAVDGIVTLHGTIGVEAAANGIPVLAAGPGWYDHLGFVRRSTTRGDYIRDLAHAWWLDCPREEARRTAEMFAGWYFSRHDDGRQIRFGEDHEGSRNYPLVIAALEHSRNDLEAEADDVNAWWRSQEQHYHTFRMRQRTT